MTPSPSPPEEPQDLAEYLWYCKHWERHIFFRAQREGKWGNVSLADLTPQEYGHKLAGLIENGRIPVRVPEHCLEDNEPC